MQEVSGSTPLSSTMKARRETGGPSPFPTLRGVVDFPPMTPEPALFDVPDEEADAAREAAALADLEAGRTVRHKAMKAWLLSWGTADELPPPQVGD
jgi:hypothetical protein